MKTILAGLIVLAASHSAWAQKEPLQPAPVPALDTGRVAPADRAGRSDAVDNSAPFSSAPSGLTAGGGQATPPTLPSTVKDQPPTPSLSR